MAVPMAMRKASVTLSPSFFSRPHEQWEESLSCLTQSGYVVQRPASGTQSFILLEVVWPKIDSVPHPEGLGRHGDKSRALPVYVKMEII
jgi:hypothetical protein